MKGYVESNLLTGESIVKRADVSIVPFLPNFIFSFVLVVAGLLSLFQGVSMEKQTSVITIAFVGVGLAVGISAFIYIKTTELTITTKRIIAKFGFIRRQTIELQLNQFEGLSVEQGIIGRIFNFGSIIIHGTGGTYAPIPSISRPLDFRRAVNERLEVA